MTSTRLSDFFPMFQQGVVVACRVGCPLGRLLSGEWGLTPDYVAERITTIFLNGRAIDNVNTAIVGDGSIIALSGAMPGLVGATLRRGGYYAAMRGAITYRETDADAIDRIATVRIKLFNLLLPELVPRFLGRGIRLDAEESAAFFRSREDGFWGACHEITLDHRQIERPVLCAADLFPHGGSVSLTVDFKDDNENQG